MKTKTINTNKAVGNKLEANRTKGNGMKDTMTLCIEALFSVIGAIGILAFMAFLTGSHMTDWNGRITAILFILITLLIWSLLELDSRRDPVKKREKHVENGKRVIVKQIG